MLAGAVTGIGVASKHYTGMAAMRMDATMSYNPGLFALSVLIAIIAATAALWAALRLRGVASTFGAALIMGVAVSGMHYTGMAAMRVWPASGSTSMASGGATASGFLLPLILGISMAAFTLIATLGMAETEEEIRAEAAMLQRSRALGLDV